MEYLFIKDIQKQLGKSQYGKLNKVFMQNFADDLFNFVFNAGETQCSNHQELTDKLNAFYQGFSHLLFEILQDKDLAKKHTTLFFDQLDSIYQKGIDDACFILKSDPAAQNIEEIKLAYPGFYATAIYRFAHQLWKQEIPILPRLWTELAHSKTGIDIHPGAMIGDNFSIDHGTGIVIGETTVIGNNVKIFQGVTLGALSVSKDLTHTKRHPTVENNVVIYSNASILGGETVIGRNAVIGGNVWLTTSVEPYSIVFHQGETLTKNIYPRKEEPLFYSI